MSNYIKVLFVSIIHHSHIAFLFLTEQNIFLIDNPYLWPIFIYKFYIFTCTPEWTFNSQLTTTSHKCITLALFPVGPIKPWNCTHFCHSVPTPQHTTATSTNCRLTTITYSFLDTHKHPDVFKLRNLVSCSFSQLLHCTDWSGACVCTATLN